MDDAIERSRRPIDDTDKHRWRDQERAESFEQYIDQLN